MRKIFNNRAETSKRQQLRREMPVAERLGWKQLRGEALGVKFRRQGFSRQICRGFLLSVASSGHRSRWRIARGQVAREHDKLRQSAIESLGARFIRVSNEDVYRSALDAAESIALVVAEMKAEFGRGKRGRMKRLFPSPPLPSALSPSERGRMPRTFRNWLSKCEAAKVMRHSSPPRRGRMPKAEGVRGSNRFILPLWPATD